MNSIHPPKKETRVIITLVTRLDGKPLGKIVSITPEHKVKKDNLTPSFHNGGEITLYPVKDLLELQAMMDKMPSNQAIQLSRPLSPSTRLICNKGQNEMIAKGYVSRSKGNFGFDKKAGMWVLDYDYHEKLALTIEEVCILISEGMQAVLGQKVQFLAVPSSSSYLRGPMGEKLSGFKGCHIHFFIDDLSRGPEITQRFFEYFIARGLGYFYTNANKKVQTPQVFVRTLVDLAVRDTTRLIYGKAILSRGMYVAETAMSIHCNRSGRLIAEVPKTLTTPSGYESAFNELKLSGDLTLEREIPHHYSHLLNPKEPQPPQVRRIIEAGKRAIETQTLNRDHQLYRADTGEMILAGDLGKEHHGLTLRDVFDPTYGNGGQKACVFWGTGGIRIHDTHCGTSFKIAPPPKKTRPSLETKKEEFLTKKDPTPLDLSEYVRTTFQLIFKQGEPTFRAFLDFLPNDNRVRAAGEMLCERTESYCKKLTLVDLPKVPFTDISYYNHGHLILNWAHGRGKTRQIIEYSKGNPNPVIVIVPKVALARQYAEQGFVSYKGFNFKHADSLPTRVVTTGHSSGKFANLCVKHLSRGGQYDVIIDEPGEVMDTITSGISNSGYRNGLSLVAQNCRRMILAGADINKRVLNMIQRMSKKKDFKLLREPDFGGKIYEKPIVLFHDDHRVVVGEAMSELSSGKRVVFGSDSVSECLNFFNHAQKTFPDKKGLLLTATDCNPTNLLPESIAFTQNPNECALKYDFIVHTPSVQSGFSVTVPYCDRGFFCSRGVLGGPEFIQMTRRFRGCKQIIVGLPSQVNKRISTSKEIIQEERDYQENPNWTPEEVWDEIALEVRLNKEETRFNLTVAIPVLFSINGFKVGRLETKCTPDCVPKTYQQGTHDVVKQVLNDGETLSEHDYIKTKLSHTKSYLDGVSLARTRTCQITGAPYTEDSLALSGGVRLTLLEKLNALTVVSGETIQNTGGLFSRAGYLTAKKTLQKIWVSIFGTSDPTRANYAGTVLDLSATHAVNKVLTKRDREILFREKLVTRKDVEEVPESLSNKHIRYLFRTVYGFHLTAQNPKRVSTEDLSKNGGKQQDTGFAFQKSHKISEITKNVTHWSYEYLSQRIAERDTKPFEEPKNSEEDYEE